VPGDPRVGGGDASGVDPTLCRRNYQKRVRVLTRQPRKDKESREINHRLLKGYLLLQTVYPAVCNMGCKESVADRANALSKAEQKWGRKRKHDQKNTKSINPEYREPKGINLRAGEDDRRCT